MTASRPNSWRHINEELERFVEENLESSVDVRILENPHDFDAHGLSVDQTFVDISKPSPCQ
jgi:hypothetical protein